MGSIAPEDQQHRNCPDGPTRLVGENADPACSRLLGASGLKRKELSPKMGTELRNIQLKDLTDDQIEDLALFIAQRGVVSFRDQDWTEEEHVAFAAKLGELLVHPTAHEGHHPAMTFMETNKDSRDVPGEVWHSDMCEEEYPPTYTTLQMQQVPPSGGDTLFSNMYAAYDKLSPPVKEFFRGKKAVNRRPLVFLKSTSAPRGAVNWHPIVRTHPLTNWNALFTNESFTGHIDGMGYYEAKTFLNFLVQHVDKGVEFQIRHHWEPDTVAIWDNRCVQHIACWDYWPQDRAGRRVVVFGGDKPAFDPVGGGSQSEAACEDGSLPPNWQRARGVAQRS